MSGVYNTISIICFSLCGVLLLLAVFMWFKFKIFKIINDLSGRTEKMEIERLRAIRAETAGNTAEQLLESSSQVSKTVSSQKQNVKVAKTEVVAKADEENDTALLEENETAILDDNETQVLEDNETQILDDNETQLIDENETEILVEQVDRKKDKKLDKKQLEAKKASEKIRFKVTESIDYHSSDETVD